MRLLYSFILISLSLLAIAFAIMNAAIVNVHLFVAVVPLSVASILLIGILVGALLSLLLFSYPFLRLRSRNRRLQKQLER
jgi:uncharacterized integral membrane protein